MKKQLDVDAIQSELRGGSAFFPGYKRSLSPTVPTDKPSVPKDQNSGQGPKINELQQVKPTPDITKPEPIVPSEGVPPPVPRTVPRTVPGTNPRTDYLKPKVKRQMRQRQPFDIYEDQYTRLKQIADSERNFINGRGMSQMVREAIDAYLATALTSDKK